MLVAYRVASAVLALVCVCPLQAAGRCEPQSVLAAAERAQGGPIHSLRLSATGHDFVVGQGYRPGGPWPEFNVESYEREINLDVSASSLREVRSQAQHPPKGGARQPLQREESFTATASGSPRAAVLRRELALLLPAGFIAAASHSKQVSGRELPGGACAVIATLEDGAPITAEIASDGTVRQIESQAADNVLGDTEVASRFMGHVRVGTWSLPAHITQRYGGFPVLDLEIKQVSVNEPIIVAADVDPPLWDWVAPASMPSERLGEGIFVIPGRYSAVAIDLGDHMAVIEGPQSEARALQIIAEARKLIPGKPIRYVINTHTHFDHASGLRTFVAEGATIITQEDNIAFLKEALNRRRTLHPDKLSQSPRPIEFVPVQEVFSLEGGGREIRLYHLHGVDHSEGMLLAYLPGPKVVVEADAFTPPAHPRTAAPSSINPYTVQLLDNIERLHLDVDRLISIHYAADGRRVGMDELRLAAGR